MDNAISEKTEPPYRFLLPDSALFHFKSIDREHQELFDILNAAAAEFGNGAALPATRFGTHILRLREGLSLHFIREEAEMLATGYGGTSSHAAHHRGVLARLDSYHAEIAARATVEAEATFELLDRLLDDVLRADLAFKDFLAAKGLITAR